MVTTEGVVFGPLISDGSGGPTWGPGGSGAGYHAGDSNSVLSVYGLAGGASWNSGFGAPSMIDISNPDNIDQNGQDIFDAGWGHARRLEAAGYFGVYWTPNNSVCWRRPPTWPSDCASAPAGDNPPTDPPHIHDSQFIADLGPTFTACAYRSNADSGFFSPNTLEITGWVVVADVDMGHFQEYAPGGFTATPLAGAIEAVSGSSGAAVRPVQSVRMRGINGPLLADGATATTWYLVEASTDVPAAGPYLIFEAAGGAHGSGVDAYYTAWKREGLEDVISSWTELVSNSVDSGTTSWVDVDMTTVQPGIDAQYARIAALGGTTLHDAPGDVGPSHFLVGLMDPTWLSDVAPVKDTTNQDGFHVYGFDSGTVPELEVTVGSPNFRYVLYDQPASVPSPPSNDVYKFGTTMTYPVPGENGFPLAYALKSGPGGVEVLGTQQWDMDAPGTGDASGVGYWLDAHPMKWLNAATDPKRVAVKHYNGFGGGRIDYFDVTDGGVGIDPGTDSVSQNEAMSVTGDGKYFIINANANGVFDLWATSDTTVKDTFLGTFDLNSQGSFIRSTYDIAPGPGSTIVGYDYDDYLEVFTVVDDTLTFSKVFIPEWIGNPGFAFTDYWYHRATLEPGTTRIWVTAYRPDRAGLFSDPSRDWDFYLVAAYDFATGLWTNILEQLADYDWYTTMGEEYAYVGVCEDGYFLYGETTPNKLIQGDPDPANNSLEMFAAFLGLRFARGITLDGSTISWAGDLRKLLYADNSYQGWQYDTWGNDVMGGGLFTHVPYDMRVFYDGADQELWVQQLTANAGSGSFPLNELLVDTSDGNYGEMTWYAFLTRLAALRLMQRNDDYGILNDSSNSIRLNTSLQLNSPTSEQASPRLYKNNPLGYR